MLPVREAPALAPTLKSTVPGPAPFAPDVIVIHELAPVAVQLQPAVVVTATALPVTPAAPTDTLVGLIENVQVGAGGGGCGAGGGGCGAGGGGCGAGGGGCGAGGGGCGAGGGDGLVPDACVTESTWPAIVSRPVRAAPLLAATTKPIDWLPAPTPIVAVSQGASLVTVHTHPGWFAPRAVDPVPPAAGAAVFAGDRA